ncbi:MAG: N-acetylglucosamine-6-phosphate deacetylase [Bacteroidota bacterium]|nr:N-acetylglucosamine-6-phosphate deacetylase [Bacteroidota bacterium]
MRTLFHNAQFFTGTELVTGKVLLTSGDRIEGFADPDAEPSDVLRIDCGGGLVTAGLIDLQIAGGGGYLFSSNPDPEALSRITESIVATGTTGFLIALPTNSDDVYRAAFATVAGCSDPAVMGLHMEGPFISHARRGAHAPELIKQATEENVNGLLSEASGTIRMMTVAPESCPPGVIRILKEHGVTVAAGHSNATFSEAMVGFRAGIATTTHLFNAMSPLHHRAPGLPGAAFLSEKACASIIADGIHVDYHMVSIAKMIMKERLFLVSDAVEVNDRGAYRHVKQKDRFTLPDGTLSGAKLTMLDGVRNCIENAGIGKLEAIRMATLYPARLIGAPDRGIIAPGARADLIIIDNEMRLKGVCMNGVTKFKE